MKKLFLLLLFSLALGGSRTWAQCAEYPYYLEVDGFSCGDNSGRICFRSLTICDDYLVDISFASPDFTVSDLGDFTLQSADPNGATVLRYVPQGNSETHARGCFEGMLNAQEAVFTVQLRLPYSPFTVVASSYFQPGHYTTVGSQGTTTLLSAAIMADQLLSYDEAIDSDQAIVVEGTLRVDMDYTFGISQGGRLNRLLMRPGARIEVEPGKQLMINQAIIKGCGGGWDRIDVLSKGKFALWNSVLSDAQVGVELNNFSAFTLHQSVFHDNKIGIGSFGPNLKNVSITATSYYLTPTTIRDGDYGCYFENVREVDLNVLAFLHMNVDGIYLANTDFIGSRLRFFDCFRGVHVAVPNRLLNLDYCNFQKGPYNIVGDYGVLTEGSLEMSVTHGYFDGLWTGIGRGTGTLNEHTLISDNKMENCDINVVGIVEPSKGEIERNDLQANQTNIGLWGLGFAPHQWSIQKNPSLLSNHYNITLISTLGASIYGHPDVYGTENNISLLNCTRTLLENNTGIAGAANGIYVSGSPQTSVRGNTVEGSTAALTFLQTCSGSETCKNDLNGGYGLSYGTPASAYATTGSQFFRGNIFEPSTKDAVEAINYSDASVAMANQYMTGSQATAQGSALWPFFISAYQHWFDNDPTQSDYQCAGEPVGKAAGSHEDLKKAIGQHLDLLSKGIGSVYGREIEFDIRLKLYRWLDELKDLEPLDGEARRWYEQMSGSDLARFIAIERAFRRAAQLSDEAEDRAEELQGQIHDRSQLLPGLSGEDKQQAKSDLLNAVGELEKLLGEKQAALEQILPEMAQLNAGISCSGLPAQNLKAAYAVLLKRMSGHFPGYAESDVETLKTIAAQCAVTGGEGVYIARALLADRTKTFSTYNDECLPAALGETLASTLPAVSGDWSMAPNPAGNSVAISLPENNAVRSVVLYDVLGLVALSRPVAPSETPITLNTSELPEGLYLVSLQGGEYRQAQNLLVKHR